MRDIEELFLYFSFYKKVFCMRYKDYKIEISDCTIANPNY